MKSKITPLLFSFSVKIKIIFTLSQKKNLLNISGPRTHPEADSMFHPEVHFVAARLGSRQERGGVLQTKFCNFNSTLNKLVQTFLAPFQISFIKHSFAFSFIHFLILHSVSRTLI